VIGFEKRERKRKETEAQRVGREVEGGIVTETGGRKGKEGGSQEKERKTTGTERKTKETSPFFPHISTSPLPPDDPLLGLLSSPPLPFDPPLKPRKKPLLVVLSSPPDPPEADPPSLAVEGLSEGPASPPPPRLSLGTAKLKARARAPPAGARMEDREVGEGSLEAGRGESRPEGEGESRRRREEVMLEGPGLGLEFEGPAAEGLEVVEGSEGGLDPSHPQVRRGSTTVGIERGEGRGGGGGAGSSSTSIGSEAGVVARPMGIIGFRNSCRRRISGSTTGAGPRGRVGRPPGPRSPGPLAASAF